MIFLILSIFITILVCFFLFVTIEYNKNKKKDKRKKTSLFYCISDKKLCHADITQLTHYYPRNTYIYCLIDNDTFLYYDCDYHKWNKKQVNMSMMAFLKKCYFFYNENHRNIFIYAGHANSYYLRLSSQGDSGESHNTFNTFIKLNELSETLESIFKNKLDLLVFDTCLLGSLESIYQFRNCAKYIVASEGYGADDGFISGHTINAIDTFDNIEHIGKVMIDDAHSINLNFRDQWNACLYNTLHIDKIVQELNYLPIIEVNYQSLPFIYKGYPHVDLLMYMTYMTYTNNTNNTNNTNSNERIELITKYIDQTILYCLKNERDDKNNTGLSFLPSINRLDDSHEYYQSLSLYKDCEWIRKLHLQYDYDIRMISINLQVCESSDDMNKWYPLLMDTEADVLFLQEINDEALSRLMQLDKKIKLLQWSYTEKRGTCVLRLTNFPYEKYLFMYSAHLDDIPAPLHIINNIPYEGNPTDVSTMDQLLNKCIEHRYHEIIPILHKAHEKNEKISIIAGDFNEPSHLDAYQNIHIQWPISILMHDKGYIDAYFYKNNNENINISYTWPRYPYYKNEPKQRIDFVYTKGIESNNILYCDKYRSIEKEWLSDHYGVLCVARIF